jgi:hypothetical protein
MDTLSQALPSPADSPTEFRVELKFRRDFSDTQISEREMDIVGSVLPELVSQLLQMSSTEDSPE